MASARKCDRCGKLYEYYDKTDMGKINGMAFIVKDDTFGSYRVQDYDLCPDCMGELIKWIEVGEKNGKTD